MYEKLVQCKECDSETAQNYATFLWYNLFDAQEARKWFKIALEMAVGKEVLPIHNNYGQFLAEIGEKKQALIQM